MTRKYATFADAVQTWRPESFYGNPLAEDRIPYTQKIRDAVRFSLDDTAVEKLVDASMISADDVWSLLPSARLPFETVWIEFNPRVKTLACRRRGTAMPPPGRPFDYLEGIPEAAGCLLQRVRGWDDVWIGTFFLGPVTTSRDNGGVEHFPGMICATRCMVALKSDVRREVLGPAEADDGEKESSRKLLGYGPQGLPDGHPLLQAVSVGSARKLVFDTAPAMVLELIRAEVAENAGLIRFIILALAFLNQCETEKVYLPGKGRTFIRGEFRKLLDTTVVRVHLPNKKTVVQYLTPAQRNQPGTPHRDHEVRGHWRHVAEGLATCSHPSLESLSAKRQWCPKCGFQRTFIKSHRRGDPALGTIQHEYRVTE